MKNIAIKESKIQGKGVYAQRDFKKGETVIVWHPEEIVSKENISKLSSDEQNHTDYIGNGKYVLMGSPEKFVNHSCSPNTYVHNKKDIAMRNIKNGEEITTDYALNGIDDWELECKCRSKNCRKTIYGDFRKLDAKTQKKLEPYLEEWYKKEIIQH